MKRFLGVVFATAMVIACSDPFSPEGVAGVYNLETVNGENLPWTISPFVVLTAWSIRLNADGTFTTTESYDAFTSSAAGTYTLVKPSTIRFVASGRSDVSGTLDGDRLTLIEAEFTLVFGR